MKIKNIKQKLFLIGAIGFSIFLLFFVIASFWIGREVKSRCQTTKGEYGDSTSPTASQGQVDCVEALIVQLNDENQGFRSRNSAIWALGQLGDNRALPVLQRYYTGNIPSKEPLDKSISQYELKKAINLTNGGFNITAIFWR